MNETTDALGFAALAGMPLAVAMLPADAPAAALRRRRDRPGPAQPDRGAMEKDFAGCG